MSPEAIQLLAAAAVITIGTIAPAIAEAFVAGRSLEGMSRNPEVADKMFTSTVVYMALLESLAIYCLVISLILLFAV